MGGMPMKKIINLVVLSIVSMLAVGSANAAVIVADRFDMDHDWSGKVETDLKGITSTEAGNTWGGIGVNYPVAINEASRFGDTGRGLRFQLAPGNGTETIGAEMSGYPKTAWEGRSQFIGYYSKISDNTNWGTKGKTLKMLRFNMERNDVIPELIEGGTYSVFIGTSNVFNGIYRPDNNWHKYLWEFTAQSNPGAADGAIRLWVDDALVWERVDVKWNSYGTISQGTHFNYGYGTSWYFFYIQGNLSRTYNGPEKFMYWDNYIIATTKEEVDSFIGPPATAAAKAMNGGAAIEDKVAPDTPTGVVATASSSSQMDISWAPAVDNMAVTGYKIYRNGTYLKTVAETSMSDTGLNPSTEYSYTVMATDAAGNASPPSIPAIATTEY